MFRFDPVLFLSSCVRGVRSRSLVCSLFLLAASSIGLSAAAQTETVLANFTGTSGAVPGASPQNGNLIQASDGNFYGLTEVGGANGKGAAFKVTPAGTYTLLHSFAGAADGQDPFGSLVQGTDGNFYGLTQSGGANNLGAAFKMTPAGVVTLLHSFAGAADGQNPYGSLVQGTDGNFYGLTVQGGSSNYGAAFKMTSAGVVTLLHSFGTADGANPSGSLVQGTDGNFYGLTQNGGANSDGAAFKMTPSGAVTLLHSFAGAADGQNPYGSLVQGTDGNFYGLTNSGGANSDGAAFKMTAAGAVTLLHSFAGAADGKYPNGSLVQGTDGNFYGLTSQGGANTYGAAFRMTPAGVVTLLHSFAGTSDGKYPQGSLVQGTDGNFYGMTMNGGTSGDGIIFTQTAGSTMAAPVALSSTATTVPPNGTFTLTYSVANAYTGATNGSNAGSSSLGYCFASNTAGDATWNGVIAGSPTATNSPALTAPASAGTYTYALTCGGMESNLVTLTVPPPPAVSGTSPTSGPTSGGTSVTVTGTNFTGATAVHFGTAVAASFTVNSATSITAVSAASASIGAVDITVTTPAGTSATGSADQFTYTQTASTLTLTASPTTSTYGSIVTLTATLNNTAASGTVMFYGPNGKLGTGNVSGGVATLTSTALPVGADSVVAVYGGDAGDTGSTSNTLTVNVSAATTAVGSTSATQQVVFNFTSTVTLKATLATAIQVVTQGAPNLDFKYASGGSCAAGTTYTSGQSCTVDFTFSPLAAGPRKGAVLLYNNNGTPAIAATDYVSGIGTGPQADFTLGVQSSPVTGLNNPQAITLDGAGNIYVANYGTSSVIKYNPLPTPGSGTPLSISGLTHPFGITVDGAGNLLVVDSTKPYLLSYNMASGTTTTFGSGLSGQGGVTVDGAGTVYAFNGSTLVKFPPGSSTPTTVASTTCGAGIAVDAAGDIFLACSSNIQEIVAGTSTPIVKTTSGFNNVAGEINAIAVDAAGNLYISQANTNTGGVPAGVYELPAGSSTVVQIGTSYQAQGMALDTSNRVLFNEAYGNSVVELDRTTTAALSFASTAVGMTSTAQSVMIEDDGTSALTLASITASNTNFTGALGTCPTTLASGASCQPSFAFTPQSIGAKTGNGIVTDNSLNVTGSTQTVALSGTGTVGTKTITFAQPATPVTAGTSATLTASTSDGDAVTFSITAGTATISGTTTTGGVTTATIVYTNPGTVTIAANSAATANASAATAVSRSVTVNAAATNFTAPATNVGTTSATQTAEVTFTTAGTPSALSNSNVLTLGLANSDFKFVSGGTCSTSTAYIVGQSCTVLYTFTPSTPGLRLGGITLTNSSNAVLGTTYLAGTGNGPLGVYGNMTAVVYSTIPSTTTNDAAFDGSGNLYVAASSAVLRVPAGGGTPVTLVSSGAGGIVVDGAGNLFYISGGTLYEIPAYTLKNGTPPFTGTSVATLSYADNSLAVDTNGNLYYVNEGSGGGSGIITKIAAGTYTSSAMYTYGSRVIGLTFDAAGDLFLAAFSGGGVGEYTAGGTYHTVFGGLSNAYGVAVDAAGNLYATSYAYQAMVRYQTSTGSETNVYGGGNGTPGNPTFTKIDTAGNLYIGSAGGNVYVYTRGPAISFASTVVGATSAVTTETFENDGNQTLTIASVGASNSNFSFVSAVNGSIAACATGSLAASVQCNINATFTPQSGGALSGSGVVTDNSLNSTGTTHTVALSGTGTLQQPTVTAVSPTTGSTAGGTTVTITGTNLLGITAVKFGGTSAASFTIVSGTSLTAVSPAGTGTVDITVSNGTYTSAASSADQFTYLTAQNITFTQPATPVFAGATATLQATGGASGNPVTFSIVSGTATLSGTNNSTITYTTAGTVVIAANQTGNSTYLAATQVTRTVVVLTQSVFIVNSGGTVTTTDDNSGATSQNSGVAGGGIGAAVDASGSFWSVYSSGAGVSKFTDTGALTANYTATNLTSGTALAIDGNGTVWISQGGTTNNVFALSNTGTVLSTTGFAQAANLSTPASVTINAAGSLWIANTGNNTVTEVIGVAAPVTTPTVQQVINGNPGAKP